MVAQCSAGSMPTRSRRQPWGMKTPNRMVSRYARAVEAGGTLVIGPDLASYDEHGQLDIERATWLAVGSNTSSA